MQKVVDEARGKGAQLVVVLSDNGMDVDLKSASGVRGVDAILGGDTDDRRAAVVPVATLAAPRRHKRRQQRQVPGVMDFEVKARKARQLARPLARRSSATC